MMLAADALTLYAETEGAYPRRAVGDAALAVFKLDWWSESTELGGDWNWFCEEGQGVIAISNPNVSDKWMRRLDQLIDDGDLSQGMFRRYGNLYGYSLNKPRGLVVAGR